MQPSTLTVFFANVTYLGRKTTSYLARRPEHIVGVAETHLKGDKAAEAIGSCKALGWKTSHTPAVPTGNGGGTRGGTMLLHKPWLQAACPAVAAGNAGELMPPDDLIWKHFRISGMHLTIGFCYWQDGIGLTGDNLKKLKQISTLTDQNRRQVVILGDFNIPPKALRETGLLEQFGLTVVTAGQENTCRASTGSSQIDYLICTMQVGGSYFEI